MYMPGRFRTASRPFNTLILLESYWFGVCSVIDSLESARARRVSKKPLQPCSRRATDHYSALQQYPGLPLFHVEPALWGRELDQPRGQLGAAQQHLRTIAHEAG